MMIFFEHNLSVQEIATLLNVSMQRIYRLLTTGAFRGKRIGRGWYIRREDMPTLLMLFLKEKF